MYLLELTTQGCSGVAALAAGEGGVSVLSCCGVPPVTALLAGWVACSCGAVAAEVFCDSSVEMAADGAVDTAEEVEGASLSTSAAGAAGSGSTSSTSSGKGVASVASVATAALLVAVASEGASRGVAVPSAALTCSAVGAASEVDGSAVNCSGTSCSAVNCSGVSGKGAGG